MSERKGTKALELWCKRLVKDCPNVQIDNMTTSWRNGIAFCALVHHFRPDLIDMSSLKPENIYENNQLAFSIAEKHLGIPALLDPEDMVDNEIPDRLSMLTYLSQFYQRLGHTVTPKASESETKLNSALPSSSPSTTPIRFGKTGLDKCAACNDPVYLAQRLMVDHKLYHRRCFRCSKCTGHLNPKNYHITEGSDFFCDSCKNDKSLNKYLNNNDQMGMLAFTDDIPDSYVEMREEDPISPQRKFRPQSILEKINMFENKDKSIEEQVLNLSLKDNIKHQTDTIDIGDSKIAVQNTVTDNVHDIDTKQNESTENSITDNIACGDTPDKTYKSNINKMIFLQTQLSSDDINAVAPVITITEADVNKDEDSCIEKQEFNNEFKDDITCNVNKDESNVTDDIRIAKSNITLNLDHSFLENNSIDVEKEKTVSVPPRRKKNINSLEKKSDTVTLTEDDKKRPAIIYPDCLNPFSDDDDEIGEDMNKSKKESTNPFGSTDEEDDDVPPIPASNPTPTRRLISANPFWSDGEEPSSDEESHKESANIIYKSSIATSTPNLQSSTPRRKKAKAPPPPKIIVNSECLATSMDDVASISSYSSYNSTDQKSVGKTPPMLKKRRVAPTPPDSLSTCAGGSMERGCDSDMRSIASDGGRKSKGPAPGLPLPERREVKLQMSPEDLQVQLDMLETQQLGLERQGVLIEQMIRDKCEGDEPSNAPQEEVEDLVIQLCELVNEKNDLFRKQTELMYIRRQQRLEQEQADIEHEIRVIQSRPAVNRIDADKAREEQLVSRLVEIVRMRDELVQQIDAERRRERQEDIAIATSIANKRAQRNSDANSTSMLSIETVASPKKSKVKDKVKKQLKKAKHTLISKKKDEEKTEKPKKSK